MSDRTGKFALQWIQSTAPVRTQSMNAVRFNIREIQHPGGQGLTCEGLHLDLLHIWFVPNAQIPAFEGSDSVDKTWRAETKVVNVALSPGERHSLLTRNKITTEDATVSHPTAHQQYSVTMHDTAYTGGVNEDYWCRTYAPTRDSPAARDLRHVTEIQIELLWPLLQGDVAAAFPSVPNYRLERVLAEFSYH
jgi:hypothetical protein